eukprot:GILI01030619.1.p2 GENE.GILI01030619.1~~GILI01030619.1.p2  ORF type:complete len:185 (-),score=28.11 GILI01030619.1:1111-1665(-)
MFSILQGRLTAGVQPLSKVTQRQCRFISSNPIHLSSSTSPAATTQSSVVNQSAAEAEEAQRLQEDYMRHVEDMCKDHEKRLSFIPTLAKAVCSVIGLHLVFVSYFDHPNHIFVPIRKLAIEQEHKLFGTSYITYLQEKDKERTLSSRKNMQGVLEQRKAEREQRRTELALKQKETAEKEASQKQ